MRGPSQLRSHSPKASLGHKQSRATVKQLAQAHRATLPGKYGAGNRETVLGCLSNTVNTPSSEVKPQRCQWWFNQPRKLFCLSPHLCSIFRLQASGTGADGCSGCKVKLFSSQQMQEGLWTGSATDGLCSASTHPQSQMTLLTEAPQRFPQMKTSTQAPALCKGTTECIGLPRHRRKGRTARETCLSPVQLCWSPKLPRKAGCLLAAGFASLKTSFVSIRPAPASTIISLQEMEAPFSSPDRAFPTCIYHKPCPSLPFLPAQRFPGVPAPANPVSTRAEPQSRGFGRLAEPGQARSQSPS